MTAGSTHYRHAVHRRHVALMLSVGVLLLAFAVRMWHLNTESVWHDEGWSIRAIQGPFTTPDDNTPYLYYVSGHVLWRLSGAEGGAPPLLFRYLSVLIGVLTVAVALWIARRFLWRAFSLRAGAAAGVLVAISPLLWEYGQEVRAYVAVPLIALLLIDAAGRILRCERGQMVPRAVWGYAFAAGLAGLYTHNLTVPLIVWMNVALGLIWLRRRDWRHMVTWGGLMAVLIVAYIPWLLTQAPSGTPLNTVPQPGFTLIRDIWYAYWLPVLPQLQARVADAGGVWWLDALGVVMLAGILVIAVSGSRGNRANRPAAAVSLRVRWILLSHVLLVPAFSFALIYTASIDFHPRYFVAAVPGTLILMVAGVMTIAGLARRFVPRFSPDLRRAALIVLVLAGALASAASLAEIRAERAYQHDDFDGLARYYAALPPGFTVLLPFETEPALQFYYTQVYTLYADFVNLPLYAEESTALAGLSAISGPVEFVTWFQLPADVRGMYPCILTAASQRNAPGTIRTFYGLSTQRFSPQVGDFYPLKIEPGYRALSPVAAGVMDSPYGVCVRTAWQLPAPTGENFSVAAELVNVAGWPVAQTDASIARADNAPTSRWQDGDIGGAYTLLILPDGAPLETYALNLTVYSDGQPSGLDVIDADGNPSGKRYTVDEAITAHAPPLSPDDRPPDVVDNTGGTRQIETGQPLDVTLVIPGNGHLRRVDITLEMGMWSQTRRETVVNDRLMWARFVVPPGNNGEAVLRVDGTEVARYSVTDIPRIFTAPAFAQPVGVDFPDAGMLTGATAPDTVIAGEAFDIALVWKAHAQANMLAYTVFVQLISPEGVNLAQSDAQPANGTRPTTGWLDGEYVTDPHTLRWNTTDYTGPATLIAGFYDADGGFRRLLTADGGDSATVAAVIVDNGG